MKLAFLSAWFLYFIMVDLTAYSQCSSGCTTTYSTCANLGATTVTSGTSGAYNVYCISPPAGCGVITVGDFVLDQYSTVRICTSSPTDTVKFIGQLRASGGGSSAANDNTRRIEVNGNVQVTFGGTVTFNSRIVLTVGSTGTLDLRPNPTGPNPLLMANSDSIVNNGKIIVNGPMNFTGPVSNRGTISATTLTVASGVTNTGTGIINTSGNITLGGGANVINFGSITSQGSFTSSAGSFFANKNYWHAIGNATFSGSYSNNSYFLSDGILTLNASGTLNVENGLFEADSLILNAGLLSTGAGCAVFKVNKYSSIQNGSGISAVPSGSIGIMDMSNPGQIDNVACGCGSSDADQLDNSITPPSGTQCSAPAAPNATGPYCGIVPLSSFSSGGPCFNALPVTFVSITATSESIGNTIKWSVVENEDNLKYEVEYSADGVYYTSIATIQPQRGSLLTNYTYTHQYELAQGLYYRIKQMDKDGKIYYSPTAYTDRTNSTPYMYPNPATDKVTIYAGANLHTVELITSNGIVVGSYDVLHFSEIDVSSFDRGIYFVRFTFNDNIMYSKLILQ